MSAALVPAQESKAVPAGNLGATEQPAPTTHYVLPERRREKIVYPMADRGLFGFLPFLRKGSAYGDLSELQPSDLGCERNLSRVRSRSSTTGSVPGRRWCRSANN